MKRLAKAFFLFHLAYMEKDKEKNGMTDELPIEIAVRMFGNVIEQFKKSVERFDKDIAELDSVIVETSEKTDDLADEPNPTAVNIPKTLTQPSVSMMEKSVEQLGGAMKNDKVDNKIPLDFLRLDGIAGAMRVFKYGAGKYEKNNYLKGIEASRLTSAALRHLLAYQDGQFLDPETNESHIDHAMCCLMMLRSTQEIGTSINDIDERS